MFGLFSRRRRFFTNVKQYADGIGRVQVCCPSQAQVLDCFAMSVVSMVKLLRSVTPGEYAQLPLNYFYDLLFARVREVMQVQDDGDEYDKTVLKEVSDSE